MRPLVDVNGAALYIVYGGNRNVLLNLCEVGVLPSLWICLEEATYCLIVHLYLCCLCAIYEASV